VLDQLWPQAERNAELQAIETALRSFTDPSITPEVRKRLLSAAAQDHVSTLVFEAINDAFSLVPAEGLSQAADWLNTQAAKDDSPLRALGDSIALAPDAAQALKEFKQAIASPPFRAQLGYVLMAARALGRVEGEHLSKVVYDLSAEKRGQFDAAMREYSLEVAEAVLPTLFALSSQRMPAVQATLSLARTALAHLGRGDTEDGASELTRGLRLLARSVTTDPTETQRPSEAEVFAMLDRAQRSVNERLRSAGVLTPESEDAVNELAADFSALVATALPLWSLIRTYFTTTSGPNHDAGALVEELRLGAQRAGPIAIKMMQSLGTVAAKEDPDDPLARLASELQDNVPPMPEAEMREQVKKGLGRSIEDAFLEFDLKPIASASVGQVHRAVIDLGLFGKREVAVKVQRPGLDAEFARASRVSRLLLGFVREGMAAAAEIAESASAQSESDIGDSAKSLAERLRSPRVQGVAKLIENTILQFIDSFSIETDFKTETKNLQRFRRELGAQPFVMAPRPYPRWSGETVLTTDFIKFEKMSSFLKRASVARSSQTNAPRSLIGLGSRPHEMTAAITDHVRRTYGLEPIENGVQATARADGGVDAIVQTQSKRNPTVELLVSAAGHVDAKGAPIPPDVERMQRLQTRFLANVVAQALVGGVVHGDPHDGNWGIAGDGETIVWFDFGQTIDFGFGKKVAPAGIGLGALTKHAELLATSALLLTDLDPQSAKAGEVKQAIVEALKPHHSAPVRERLMAMTKAALEVLADHGIGFSSTFTQGLKIVEPFNRNFSALAEAAEKSPDWQTAREASVTVLLDIADALTFRIVGAERTVAKDATRRRNQRRE
jgi:predicted unusual protein kinase regulating ubiquinone biosynthesis (AarF/ABC1/UbiB family)